MIVDIIGREINVGDYVFNGFLYEVLAVNKSSLVGFLANPSKTTHKRVLNGDQCCLITKEEYLLSILKK
jgi:hypothetical protein